jgi:hypothetical protein
MLLQERWEANEARKAYVAAMAEFKMNPPEIFKDKRVAYKTDKGTTSYEHATIGNVVENIVGGLALHGFSHRWILGREDGGIVTVTCVITHKLGHSEDTKLSAGLDSSGGKNNIQSQASTITYLERYSLLAACGLATKEMGDDDGHIAERKTETRKDETPAPKKVEAYSDAKFAENRDTWRKLIESGKKTPASLIATLSTKTALTDAQKSEIEGWTKKPEAQKESPAVPAQSSSEFDAGLDAEYCPE